MEDTKIVIRLSAGFNLPGMIRNACSLVQELQPLHPDIRHAYTRRYLVFTPFPNTVRGMLVDIAADYPAIVLMEETADFLPQLQGYGIDPGLTRKGDSRFTVHGV